MTVLVMGVEGILKSCKLNTAGRERCWIVARLQNAN